MIPSAAATRSHPRYPNSQDRDRGRPITTRRACLIALRAIGQSLDGRGGLAVRAARWTGHRGPPRVDPAPSIPGASPAWRGGGVPETAGRAVLVRDLARRLVLPPGVAAHAPPAGANPSRRHLLRPSRLLERAARRTKITAVVFDGPAVSNAGGDVSAYIRQRHRTPTCRLPADRPFQPGRPSRERRLSGPAWRQRPSRDRQVAVNLRSPAQSR